MFGSQQRRRVFECLVLIPAILAAPIGATALAAEKPEVYAQMGHTSAVDCLAVSPDGRYAFSGSSDKVMKQWDLATGREMKTFRGHAEAINAIAVSPDGRVAASAGDDNSLRLWDIDSGRSVATFNDANSVEAVAYSPEGHLASGNYNGTVKLWDVNTGTHRVLKDDFKGEIRGLMFLPGGAQIAVGQKSGFSVVDIQSGQVARTFGAQQKEIKSVAFSPDGRYVLMGMSKYFALFDIQTGSEVRTFEVEAEDEQHQSAFAFSPDSRLIVSGGRNYTVRLWDAETGKVVRKENFSNGRNDFYGSVRSQVFCPGGRLVLSGYGTGIITLWDIFKIDDAVVHSFGGTMYSLTAMALSRDGRYALAGDEKKACTLWDTKTGKKLRSQQHEDQITSVTFSPQGKYYLTGEYETVKVWDAETGTLVKTFTQPENEQGMSHVYDVAISADGRTAASGGKSNIMLMDLSTMREIRILPLPGTFAMGVAFSPDGRALATGDLKGHLTLWDPRTGRNLWTVDPGGMNLSAVGFSPGGKTIATGTEYYSSTDTLKLWDAASGRELRNFGGYNKTIRAAAFYPDGSRLITGGAELKLWELPSTREVQTLEGHVGYVKDVACPGNGRYFFSAGTDGTVRQWDAATGREIAQFINFADGEWIVITPEGYYSASANADKYLNVRIANAVYGIDNYREAFFRPDLVTVALSGGSLKDFRTLAEVKQPPTVNIVETPTSITTDTVTVTLHLTDNGGGIGDIRLYLNGTAVLMDSRAVAVVAKDTGALVKKYTLKLTGGVNVITATAFNAENTMQSNAARLSVTATYAAAGKPSLSALVIGINEFKNPKLTLNYSVADATLFAATLENVSKGIFDKVNIRTLTTTGATTNLSIIREIQSFQSLRPDDLFVFYIASHGTVDDGEYFLITSNVGSLRTEKLKTDAISQNMLKEAIANIPATKKLIIIDTCNAGALGDALQVALMTRGMSEDTALKILSRAVGSTILSASTSVQEALEGYRGHGLFTYVLVEGLTGKADKGNTGYIKTTELADYVDSEVPVLAEKAFKRAQYPTISINGQAFPIGKVQ